MCVAHYSCDVVVDGMLGTLSMALSLSGPSEPDVQHVTTGRTLMCRMNGFCSAGGKDSKLLVDEVEDEIEVRSLGGRESVSSGRRETHAKAVRSICLGVKNMKWCARRTDGVADD